MSTLVVIAAYGRLRQWYKPCTLSRRPSSLQRHLLVVAESLFVGIDIAGRVRALSQLQQANFGGLHALHTLLSG